MLMAKPLTRLELPPGFIRNIEPFGMVGWSVYEQFREK
jgi:hypothetical protein